MRSYIRLLHTSDLHLGRLERDDGHGTWPLEQMLQTAIGAHADAVLLCGDIFDHNRVQDKLLKEALALLGQLRVPTIILPGNHDCLCPGSVYERMEALGLPDHLHIIRPEKGLVTLPQLDLAIWGRAHDSYNDMRPLEDIPAPSKERWQVAMAHGHLVRGAWDLQRSYLIFPDQIAASSRTYVALGHWELPHQIEVGDVVAAYCGAPDRTGHVLLVELDHKVKIRPYPLPGH